MRQPSCHGINTPLDKNSRKTAYVMHALKLKDIVPFACTSFHAMQDSYSFPRALIASVRIEECLVVVYRVMGSVTVVCWL